MNAPSLKLRWTAFIGMLAGFALTCGQALAEEHAAVEGATHVVPQHFVTPVFLFIGIIAVYTIISLAIGGKKTYFEPYNEPAEEETKSV